MSVLMHEAVTISTTTTKNFFSPSTEELLSPISLASRLRTADKWSHSSEVDSEVTSDDWLPRSDLSSSQVNIVQRAPSAPIQRLPTSQSPQMDGAQSTKAGSAERPAPTNGSRWRLNGSGQLVDSEAASGGWDLADEIVRLKIGEVSEDVHSQLRTPQKSRIGIVSVMQMNEASPLETSSDASVGSSPHPSDHETNVSHSRGSSTDTTVSSSHESVMSGTSQVLLAPSPLKVGTIVEVKERPHSFSGGLSSADLRRLQQVGESGTNGEASERHMQAQQASSNYYRENAGHSDKQLAPEQLTYPSLASQVRSVPHHQVQAQQVYDYRPALPQATQPHRDDPQVEYNTHRNMNSFSPLPGLALGSPAFENVNGRGLNHVTGLTYRPVPRGFNQQGLMTTPTTMGYPGGHHTSHLSLGNTQQLYDMMLSGQSETHHPAVARVQQQHNVFRATHHHSASDPSNMRDAATLAMLNGNLQAFGPPGTALFSSAIAPPPPMGLYPAQFYGTQEAYTPAEVAMAARLQAQYPGPYGVPQSVDAPLSSPVSVGSQNGPSANNRKLGLYKTELCRSWEEKGTCRYGAKCQFAHGEDELRKVSRHPKYKTEICRTFWVSGSCPYGKRCCFIHTELPAPGAPLPPGAANVDNPPQQSQQDGRSRSLSINSDPNDASVSLLARISARRSQEASGSNSSNTPVELTPQGNGFHFNSRPPTGSLRVDTSALDNPVVKQNKSAYPSFASNGILLPATEQVSVHAGAPVTAGPDLGRHNNSRLEIVGYNQPRMNKTNSANSNIRHSFNGTEVDLNFNASPPSMSGHSSFTLTPTETNSGNVQRPNGHVRSGSAGNWGSFSRSSHLAPSPYPTTASPGGEAMMNMPWSTSELAVGSSRLHEKSWA